MAHSSGIIDQGSGRAARDDAHFIEQLQSIVGPRYVLIKPQSTLRYRTGFRCGTGPALAVVRPGNLVEKWRVLKACVAANKIILMQAANTGLTGGSVPDGNDYDRGIVIVNTLRIRRIRLINEGRQAICFAGSTLFELEKVLKPLGREPHSVIGSSCIGASVVGGICNNSGGALIHRGPAFTELALFACVDENGRTQLINHLGIRLGGDAEEILGTLDRDAFTESDIEYDSNRLASDNEYLQHVRNIDSDTPARFNADPRRLFEASGSAGKVMIFAVRLDTFAKQEKTKVFYIGTNEPAELTEIRRHMLAHFRELPIAAEYLHREAFDIAERYGKDTFLAIRYLGTNWLPTLFAIKGRFDALTGRLKFLPRDLSDRIMHAIGRLFPNHLPARIKRYRDEYQHHLLLKMAGDGIGEARRFLQSIFPSTHGAFFECTEDEGERAFLHRFVTAGAAVRYRAMHRHEIEDIIALDVALRRNERVWFEILPDDVTKSIVHKLYYGHFFCHVFHQDYVIGKGHDSLKLETRMCALLDARGAEYPAEHNVGHLYNAKPALLGHYMSLDPRNCFNPGIGRSSKCLLWRRAEDQNVHHGGLDVETRRL